MILYTKKPLMDFPKNFPDVNRIEVISSEGKEYFWDVYDGLPKPSDGGGAWDQGFNSYHKILIDTIGGGND